MNEINMEPRHDSVLAHEVLEALALTPSDTVVDATIGGAGHFREILHTLGADGVLIGIDADPSAVERGREVYAEDRRPERPVTHLVNDNFRNLRHIAERLGVGTVNAILLDLGWSGFQIASPRGFSFQHDEPLLMTYGEGGETAADLVNRASEQELSDILHTYGEERFARSIARAIVAQREKGRILTTGALVEAVKRGTPGWYHRQRINPATRTFQALRIAVNDEIGALREGLSASLSLLAPGGRLAVISFHSIEDRIVKNMLRDAVYEDLGALTPKKPIVPSREEVSANRRSRSAKLRVFTRSAETATPSDIHTPLYTYA